MHDSTEKHLRHEMLSGGISNAVFNGLGAWLLLRNGPALQWGGEHSFAVDIVATALLLPFIVALIVIPIQRRKLRRGVLPPMRLTADSRWQKLADNCPESLFKSAVLFGTLGTVVVAPATLLVLYMAGVEQIAPLDYAVFKGLWAGAMAALMLVPMVLYALRTPVPHPA